MDIYTEDILKLMKRLKKYRSIKFGKEGYDYEKAIKSDPIIRELSIKYLWVSDNLSQIVYEMNKRISKDGIRIVEPSDDPLGVAWKKDIFGNVKQWEQIRKEIRCLILEGETLGDHQRRLQRTYHLYPDKVRKPGIPQADRNILVKLLWDEVAKEYENVSDEEKRRELDWRRAAGLCDRPRQKRRRKLNCSS